MHNQQQQLYGSPIACKGLPYLGTNTVTIIYKKIKRSIITLLLQHCAFVLQNTHGGYHT